MDYMDRIEEAPQNEKSVSDHLRVLLKRKWTIIAVTVMVALIGSIKVLREIPLYRADARIVIEKDGPNVLSIQEVIGGDARASDNFQTQLKMIQSRSVAQEIIRRLNLLESKEFFPDPRTDPVSLAQAWFSRTRNHITGSIASLIATEAESAPTNSSEAGGDLDAEPPIPPWLVSSVINRIQVSPVQHSRLVDVGVTANDPRLAARMADTAVAAYIDQNLETKLQATKDAVRWLTERIADERKKVEAAERALLEYRKDEEIITDLSSNVESITAEKLSNINQQIIDAESERVQAETRYRQAMALQNDPEMFDAIPEVLGNDLVKDIKRLEMELHNRRSELSKKYGANHPRMVAIESELAQLAERKTNEAKRIVTSLRNQYNLALAREKSLKNAMESQKRESLELNKKAIQYRVLQRQAESSKHMYDLLIQRFKETSLVEEMKTGNIRIIDKAQVPARPFSPDVRRGIVLSLVLGLFLGGGLAFVLEYLDNTLKYPEEIKDYLGLAYIGMVPAYDVNEKLGDIDARLITAQSTNAPPSEGFRAIRTAILFSSPDVNMQVLLVGSAVPAEGKTLCAANIAVTMAQAGSRTLLIDCDLRRPNAHKLFAMSRKVGLSDIISGTTEPSHAIHATQIENLDLLPSGTEPPNPSEMLGSNRMSKLLEGLRTTYDRIVLDTPPVSAVTDAVVLAPRADGCLLIIRGGVTPRKVVQSAVEKLRMVGAGMIGAVMNAVDVKRSSYYYHKYNYYYDQYSYGSNAGAGRRNKT